MSRNFNSDEENPRNRSHFNIGIFMAVLLGAAILIIAGFLGNRILSEYHQPEETKVQEAEAGQKTASAPVTATKDGEVLNIYGQPLKEPKPKYVPVEETEAEEKDNKKKKEKAIYLEAIDNSNVHTEAGQDYPSIDVTEIGEQCKYLGVNEYGWLYIETEDGNQGYVYQTHFANIDEVIN